MKKDSKKVLKIELEGDEIKSFNSLIEKVETETKRSGFNTFDLDKKEKDLLKNLKKDE